jgi:hypothetical protein
MRLAALLLLAIVGLSVAACGGNGANGNSSANGAGDATASGTGPGRVRALSEEEFPAVRDGLADQLESIGVNIGAVPEDFRRAILADCASLASRADDDDVEAICSAIGEAMDRNDSGRVDRIIAELRALERD